MLLQAKMELEGQIEMARARARRMDYQVIGKLVTIVLDVDRAGGNPAGEVEHLGRRIAFTGQAAPAFATPLGKTKLYPVALSLDQKDLLLPAGLPKELPKIPRPGWQGRLSSQEETPWVEQRYEDRASGRTMLLNREWLIFRPVVVVHMSSVGFFKGVSWPKIFCSEDASGQHTALLLDLQTGEAHLLGGRIQPVTYQRYDYASLAGRFSP